jgi:hypothetical protein
LVWRFANDSSQLAPLKGQQKSAILSFACRAA